MPNLDAVNDRLLPHVQRGAIPGMVFAVAIGSDVSIGTVGTPAFASDEPLTSDAIFRVASLVKPIAAVVAMTLVEDGTIALGDAVDQWLPELAAPSVLRSLESELDDTVPAERPITVEDLLTFRAGFGIVMAPPGTYPIQTAEAELGLKTLGPPWPPTPLTIDGWMAAIGTLPLMDQPGELWRYNTGAQILGVLMERAAGLPIDDLFRERVFDPLGMDSTGFTVRDGQLDRLTTMYEAATDADGNETGRVDVLDAPIGSWWATPASMPSASSWLVSTIDDYWKFVAMLNAKGAFEGGRILHEASVEAMLLDRLSSGQRDEIFHGTTGSWGLGLMVPANGTDDRSAGAGYGWDGGSGCTWRTNPLTGVTGILFTQRTMTSPDSTAVFDDFWAGVTEAVG